MNNNTQHFSDKLPQFTSSKICLLLVSISGIIFSQVNYTLAATEEKGNSPEICQTEQGIIPCPKFNKG